MIRVGINRGQTSALTFAPCSLMTSPMQYHDATLATFSAWLMFFPPPSATPLTRACTKSNRLRLSTRLCKLTTHRVTRCRIGLPGFGRVAFEEGRRSLRKKPCRDWSEARRASGGRVSMDCSARRSQCRSTRSEPSPPVKRDSSTLRASEGSEPSSKGMARG
jgi:hypothetical protein